MQSQKYRAYSTLVYKISNEDSDRCGVGQVGWRPLKHRINEHTWAAPSRNPYAQTDLVPFRDATVVAKENNPHLRLAFEAIHIYLNPNCITAPSVDITVWHNTLDKLSPKGRFPAGGGDPPRASKDCVQTNNTQNPTNPSQSRWTGKLTTRGTHMGGNGGPHALGTGMETNMSPSASSGRVGPQTSVLPVAPNTAMPSPTQLTQAHTRANPKDYLFVLISHKNRSHLLQHTDKGLSKLLPTDACPRCKTKCDLTSPGIKLCTTCRTPYHLKCLTGDNRNAPLFLCESCDEFCTQCANGTSIIRFLNPSLRGCTHHHTVHQNVHNTNGDLNIDISRCGQTVIDILLNDATRDPSSRSAGICGPAFHDRNTTYPRSLFLQANQTFFNIINNRDTREGIEDANGLIQQLIVQNTLGTNAGWCTCDLLQPDAPNKLCMLHYIFFGKPPAFTRVDVPEYRRHIAEDCTDSKLCGNRFETLPVPMSGVKCFFNSIAMFLFGIHAFGGILKQKAILWILERPLNDPVLSPWSSQSSDTVTIEERDAHLSRLATGPVCSEDFPILCCWAMADLWVDLVVFSDMPNLSGKPTVFHAAETVHGMQCHHILEDLYQNTALTHPTSPSVPKLPQVPIVHRGEHFAPLHWQFIDGSPFAYTSTNYAIHDNGGYRKRVFAPLFLANILADRDLKTEGTVHPARQTTVPLSPTEHASTISTRYGISPHATEQQKDAERTARVLTTQWPQHAVAQHTAKLLHDGISGTDVR